MITTPRDSQWFIDRIGKKIYRKKTVNCPCAKCSRYENYIEEDVEDEYTAGKLYRNHLDNEEDFFDTPEEIPEG